MSGPDLNPLTAKLLGGADFRARLRDQLLAKAEQTEDPAYARRLKEAADGKRPLRTLLQDPAFMAAHGMTDAAEKDVDAQLAEHLPKGTPAEVREALHARLAAVGAIFPTLAEAQALTDDVIALQGRAAQVLAKDRAARWEGSVDRLAEPRERTNDPGGSGQ